MAEARSKIIHQPKFSDLASGGMAQTNWKFVETLLKECKTKVNFLLCNNSFELTLYVFISFASFILVDFSLFITQ